MTRNQDLNVLHVDDATQWAAPLDARVVSGDTLIFDFVYFLHPVSISLPAQLPHASLITTAKDAQYTKTAVLGQTGGVTIIVTDNRHTDRTSTVYAKP